MSTDALAVVVVTHNSAESVETLVDQIVEQLGSADELVVVDNASSDDTVRRARSAGDRVRVVENEVNLGFGAGCHAGARATSAPLLWFVNPDCSVEPGCLEHLRRAGATQPGWGAWQAAVLLPEGQINTDGGIVHYAGFGWAGDCGKPASTLPLGATDVTFPSGAALVVRREVWQALDGFDPSYFMYSEDLDLGLRLWLSGHRAGIVPEARVIHTYEFDKGPRKWYWLERNRWRTVLSVYPLPLLVLVAPVLVAVELALLGLSVREGWLTAKLRAEADVLLGLAATLRRRRAVQAMRRISVYAFSSQLTASLDSDYIPIREEHWAARLQRRYWMVVQRVLSLTAR